MYPQVRIKKKKNPPFSGCCNKGISALPVSPAKTTIQSAHPFPEEEHTARLSNGCLVGVTTIPPKEVRLSRANGDSTYFMGSLRVLQGVILL